MAQSRGSDFMFCDLCGTMLSMVSTEYVQCPRCKSRKSAKGLKIKEIRYKVSAEDMRRYLGLSAFQGKMAEEDMLEIDKKCERCTNTKLKYKTRQVRAADEGQTAQYFCIKCFHTFLES